MKSKYNIMSHNLKNATRLIMSICWFFGMFPVRGLVGISKQKLRFTLKSLYTIVCFVTVVGQVFICISYSYKLINKPKSPRIFYKFGQTLNGAALIFLLLRLAKHWPDFMHKVSVIEKSLPKLRSNNVTLICYFTAIVVFIFTLVEYVLSLNFYMKIANACKLNGTQWEAFYLYTMPGVSSILPFSIPGFTLTMIFATQSSFVLSFVDVLIMTISLYLTSYFKELNESIMLYKDKYPNIWSDLRLRYTKLTRLVKLVDGNIGPLILLSFGFHLNNICVNLFKIMRKGLAHEIRHCDAALTNEAVSSMARLAFFTFATVFQSVRMSVTALLASRLHETAHASETVLHDVPTSSYSKETHRFLEQIQSNTVALTGLHFFNVTKQMILGMVSSIITYELVLLQFSR